MTRHSLIAASLLLGSTLPALTILADPTCNVLRYKPPAIASSATATPVRIATLINQLSDQDPFTNGDAATQLAAIGEPTVSALLAALRNDDANVRHGAAIALWKMAPRGGLSTLVPLQAALQDKSANVRWCAALALGKYGASAKDSAPDLARLLHDADRDVAWAAYTALLKISPVSLQGTPTVDEVIGQLETLTPEVMREMKVPGVSIALIKNGEVSWTKAFGLADVAANKPATSDTVFEACSMSKPMLAYLVLHLVDEGQFELDRPLITYLTNNFVGTNEDFSKQITARMILAHTSGLPNWRKGGEERDGPVPILFKPGTRFEYSGEGFFYLQRVVEHITGEPLDALAKRWLFDPLGLSATSFVWSQALEPHIAIGYDDAGTARAGGHYTHANAAYTLYTTPTEYAKLMLAIVQGNATAGVSISPTIRKDMLMRQVRVESREFIDRPGRALGQQAFRGLGWCIDATITGDIVYHSGANQTGFRCYAQLNPRNSSGLVIMTNGYRGNDLWHRLISAVGDW
jgi:CubicO group peptidase (beta-lactamase class C family)